MRKRSKYRPREIVFDTMAYIKQGDLPATAAKTVILRERTAYHGSMDLLVKGKGTKEEVIVLGHMLTTATSLAKHAIGRDWLPELTQACNELAALAARGGNFTMKASEITALNLALEIHDAQLDGCTVKQLEDAINAAMRAIRCGHEVADKTINHNQKELA
jgi:hypothetical protein